MPFSDQLGQFSAQQQKASEPYRDQAPSLAPWGALSARIAQFIKHAPGLADRLLCAPRAAFHATAIYLLHHTDVEPQKAGVDLLALSPVALITKCFAPAPGYMAALRKCGPVVHQLSFYADLNQLLLSSLADEIASEKFLTPQLLAFIRETQALDPLVLPARHGLHLKAENARRLDAMLKFCRRLGVLREYGAEAKLVRHAVAHSLGRFLEKRLERCVSPWNLELPSPLRQIKTARELIELAYKHGNCLHLVRFRVQLGLGSHIYIVGDAPLNCVLELRHEYQCLWAIMDAEYLETQEKLPRETREQICASLQQAGLDVIPAAFDELWAGIEPFYSPESLCGGWV